MWDVDATREQLEAEAPHRVYVVDTYSRVQRLIKVLRSLSVIEKLLSLDTSRSKRRKARFTARRGSAWSLTPILPASPRSVTAYSC
jgi:hypothetical protein